MASPTLPRLAPERFLNAGAQHFGEQQFQGYVSQIDLGMLETCLQLIQETQAAGGRVFTIGNGGSYDNSMAFTKLLNEVGITARVPGHPDRFWDISQDQGYEHIYDASLKEEGFNSKDLLLGLSGSGNSPNIIHAFKYAQSQNGRVFGFTGRDGGQMLPVLGQQHCMIAPIKQMEFIEDFHLIAATFIGKALAGTPLSAIRDRLAQLLKETAQPESLSFLHGVATAFENTVYSGGRVFVIGHSVFARHWRSDLMRGTTEKLPLRGICAPEIFSIGSGQATANDDGLSFVMVHGLEKYDPADKDVFLVLGKKQDPIYTHLVEYLAPHPQVYWFADFYADWYGEGYHELAESILGHFISCTINKHMLKVWDVQPFQDQRLTNAKPSFTEIKALEEALTAEGTLAADRVISYWHGQSFSGIDPTTRGIKRAYY